MSKKEIAVIAGVGQGLGEHLCRSFSSEGYHVVALARTDKVTGPLAEKINKNNAPITPIQCDLANSESINDAFEQIKHLDGNVSVYIHNASMFVMDEFLGLKADQFEDVWRISCFSAFQLSQLFLPEMVANKTGAILFTGATAATRGNKNFAAFASAKFALRGLSQSLAREFGPKGVHVAHIILDGIIYCDWTRERFGCDRQHTLLPEDIAENYLYLVRQHRSTWTQELDLRPDNEKY